MTTLETEFPPALVEDGDTAARRARNFRWLLKKELGAPPRFWSLRVMVFSSPGASVASGLSVVRTSLGAPTGRSSRLAEPTATR